MTRAQLFKNIQAKKSFLCVGLDPDISRLPSHLMSGDDPVFQFNKEIIDATKNYCVAYKLNSAFYECLGVSGWNSMEKTLVYISETTKNLFTIADAKRGDIGNTSKMYAKTFFDQFAFDALTVAPYMGSDSVLPFLEYKDKWVILLALTSNTGADNFQKLVLKTSDNAIERTVFGEVIDVSKTWGNVDNMMYVVGATQAILLKEIRKMIPHHFLLIPGVGAQGGSLEEVAQYGMNSECGLLVNSSRNIIYAGSDKNFASAAGAVAKEMQEEMARILSQL